MKAQLHRMKQRAAQTVGRAEKTELLTEHLQSVERTVEKVKLACTLTSKKLNACTISNGPDFEKRKKKLPQLHLGQSMVDSAAELGQRSLLGSVMLKAGEAQGAIAGELATYETELDEHVLAPLHDLTEVQIPNIALTKKKLSTAQLDMDSAKARWLSAQKIAQNSTSTTNKVELAAKSNLLQSEYEDQSLFFQHTQDQMATDMMTFVAGERQYAQWIFQMLEAQMRYHQASLDILKECVPLVTERIEEDIYRPTFGCPLDVHLKNTQRDIATVIEDCVLFLYNNALDMQGLFRLAGSSSKVKKLKAALNVGIADLEDYICDVHAVTGVLKLYLRELPDPLLTFELYEDWINSSKIKGTEEQVRRIQELVQLLPKANKDNLRYLVCFLAKLAEHSEENKMSASNIAIVIGPNVLWDPNDGGMNVSTTGNISIILEILIENCAAIFPEGCDFSRQHPVDGENMLHNRFDSVEQIPEKKSDSKEDMSSPEHSALGNIYNDMFKKKKEKKDQSLEKKNGNSKEDLPSLNSSGNNGGGGGENIYSDMFKKLTKEKKDGHHGSAEGVPGGGMQGYYNPISAQISDDSFTSPPTSPDGPPANPPFINHRKNPSNAEALPTAMVEHDDQQQSESGHQRSVSAGNLSYTDIKTQPSPTPGKTRRPAPPPPPKHPHPSLMPPKSKPPEPPKHKPPEPPSKPPSVPPVVVAFENEEGS